MSLPGLCVEAVPDMALLQMGWARVDITWKHKTSDLTKDDGTIRHIKQKVEPLRFVDFN